MAEQLPAGPLLVTDDPRLLDELQRLAAACGLRSRVARSAPAACRDWADSPLAVVGGDLAAAMAEQAPLRHPRVVVAAYAPGGADERPAGAPGLWRAALRLGAQDLVVLPAEEGHAVELFTALAAPCSHPATVLGVLGGRGGGGASTLCVALALAGVRARLRTLLLDCDPLGGGLDVLLGQELAPGARWPDLLERHGRSHAGGLWQVLPKVSGAALLTWDHRREEAPEAVPPEAMRSVLNSAAHAELIVADLPRSLEPAAREVAYRASAVLVALPDDLHSGVAAARVAARLARHTAKGRLVVRVGTPAGLSPEVIATSVGLPLSGEIPCEPGIARLLAKGETPGRGRRSPLRGFSDACVRALSGPEGRTAP